MKPAPFAYHAPRSLDEAVSLLAGLGPEAKPLAGGQSLVPLMNFRLARPAHLVDLNRVAGLDRIEARDGGVAVGAMVRHRDAERSTIVVGRCPLLARALGHVGHAAIRARGTVGGSVAHADPAAELPALLRLLDGRVSLASVRGTRTVPAAGFFVDVLTTAAEPDELLTEAWFPERPVANGTAWLELTRRHGDFAVAGVGVTLGRATAESGYDARIVLFGVGSTPIRAVAAESFLGGADSPAAFTEAGRIAGGEIQPESDIHATAEYRRDVAATLVERALDQAARALAFVAPPGGSP